MNSNIVEKYLEVQVPIYQTEEKKSVYGGTYRVRNQVGTETKRVCVTVDFALIASERGATACMNKSGRSVVLSGAVVIERLGK